MRLRAPAGSTRFAPDAGAAYVEFLMAFIPLFFMFMGMVQMALMYAGDLVVQHSASRAARSAAVVLDDDPERYDGQDRRSVQPGDGEATSALGELPAMFGAGGGGGGSGATGGARMGAIRTAAMAPLLAIAPSVQQLVPNNEAVMTAIGNPMSRGAGGVVYSEQATAVTFPDAPGSNNFIDRFPTGDDVQVTARVTYLFHCGVPLANRLMCETYPAMQGLGGAAIDGIMRDVADGSLTWEEAQARIERIQVSVDRRDRDGEDALEERETAGLGDMAMLATAATGARFKVLRGEATMPLQYARYRYESE